MTRGHPAVTATIRLLEDYAILVERAETILDEELRAIDWHPTASMSDGMPRGASDSTPVERAIIAQASIEADRAQLEDDMRTIASIVHSAKEYVRTITARGPLPKLEVQRCNGKVNPSCTEAAAEHRDANGSIVEGMCSTCFMKVCRGCYEREGTTRRQITVDGRLVPGCDACRRREERRSSRVA